MKRSFASLGFAVTLLFVVAPAFAVGPDLTPQPCTAAAGLRSPPGTANQLLTVNNTVPQPISLAWLDGNGREGLGTTIQASKTAFLKVAPGWTMVVRDSQGECIAVFVMAPEGGNLTVRDSMLAARNTSGSAPFRIRPANATPAFIVSTLLEVRPTGPVGLPRSRQVLSNSNVIDRIAKDLNAAYALPRDIPVSLQACGTISAFYTPQDHSITICDEWVDLLTRVFDEIRSPEQFTRAVLAATGFAFAHEAGHALIDQYQLGFTGREEDVADQFAVYLLAGTPTGASEVLSGAAAFGLLAERGANGIAWDEHAFSEQRYYNIMCWAYGSDPARYSMVLTSGGLPQARAKGCQDEYRKLAAGFDQLLQSHRKGRLPLQLSPRRN